MKGNKGVNTIVVGMGVMGSAALYECAKRGVTCIGVEQFSLPHSRGSSHGHTRITRVLYRDPHFAALAKEAWKKWRSLEEEANTQLIVQTGGIDFAKTNGKEFKELKETCEALDIEHKIYNSEEIAKKYPGFSVPSDYSVIHTHSAGIIQANKSVATLQTQAKLKGVEIIDDCELINVKNSKGLITLYFRSHSLQSKGEIFELYCEKLIICPGAWITPLLQSLFDLSFPSTVIKQGYWYFEAKEKELFNAERFPVFIDYGNGAEHVYGTPSYEYPGLLKVGGHGDQFIKFATTANDRSFVPNEEILNFVKAKTKLHFPGVKWEQPVLSETCLYTWTKNEQFILDYLPSDPHIIVGGGGSGHAFKHGTVIGHILADLSQNIISPLNSSFFSFNYHLTDSKL